MRKFAGYIAIVVTLLFSVIFNVTVQVGNLNSGLEYGQGYEAVYRIDLGDSTKKIEDIVDIFTNRLEDSGVRNGNIESVVDQENNENQIRVTANSQSEKDFEYIIRSLEATGKITASAVLNEGEYAELSEPFQIGTAKVEWTGPTPYVEVEVTDYDKFNLFIETCNEAYKKFNEKYNPDAEQKDDKLKGVIVLWLDKLDSDSYLEAFENENKVIQEEVKSKILSIVPTSYFKVEKDINDKVTKASLLIDRYDFDQTPMVGESAHTIERLLNYQPQDYKVDRLYVQKIDATYGNNSYNLILIGVGVAILIASVFMIVRYGLPGLSGAVSLILSSFISLLVFNFFAYPITTMVIVGFVISIALNLILIIPLLEHFRNELLAGKSPVKASQEAFRQTRIASLDVLICSLLVSVITTVASINQVKLLPITLTISSIVSYVVVRLAMLLMMWWLTSSKISEKKGIFMIKEKDVPNLQKNEVQTKFNFMNKFDTLKHQKKASLITLITSAVAALIILVVSLIPGFGTFNYTQEFSTGSRVEVQVEVTGYNYLFENKEEVNTFFKDQYDLVPTNISINKVENVVLDSSNHDDLPTYAYISIEFDGDISSKVDYSTLETNIKSQEKAIGENVDVYLAKTKSTMPNFILMYSIITLVTFGLISSVYYLVRFKYSYGLASLATVVPSGLATIAFLALTRIPTSPLVLMGVAAGLLLGALIQIPFFSKIKKLTRESRTKVKTFEQRKEIILRASQESLHIVVKDAVILSALIIIVCLFAPLDIYTVFAGMLISLVLVTLLTCFLLTPVYLKIEEYFYGIHLKNLGKKQSKKEIKGKKRLNKIKEAHKNVGSEPEESIIPGIND